MSAAARCRDLMAKPSGTSPVIEGNELRTRSIAFAFGLRGLLLAIVSLVCLPATAGAHPGNPDFRSVFQRFSPQVSGVSVQVLNWDSDYQLSNPGHHTVVIYGYDHDQY